MSPLPPLLKRIVPNLLLISLILFLVSNCIGYTVNALKDGKTVIGIEDKDKEKQIVRLNTIYNLISKNEFSDIEKLIKDEIDAANNDFSKQHLLNELADLYSYRTFDIEKAVTLDEEIIKLGHLTSGAEKYFLNVTAANSQILISTKYRDDYVNISSQDIITKANKRLKLNQSLLKGLDSETTGKYTAPFLQEHKQQVINDLKKTFEGTPEYYLLISRLIRAEYELFAITNDLGEVKDGYPYFQLKKIDLTQIFFSEINFLALSKYCLKAFEKTNDIELAELAFESIYTPYLKMEEEQNRYLYNALVNNYINTLIGANYQRKANDEMLYYISLNKSRMILEDKIKTTKKSIYDQHNNSKNTAELLPQKEAFFDKIKHLSNYLDFYISGDFKEVENSEMQTASVQEVNFTAANSLTTVRGMKSTKAGGQKEEAFVDENMIITYVKNGHIESRFIDKETLSNLKEKLDKSLKQLIPDAEELRGFVKDKKTEKTSQESFQTIFSEILGNVDFSQKVYISADKWLNKYPLNFYIGNKIVRVLNAVAAPIKESQLSQFSIVGYFNPTGDLPGTEKEKQIISSIFGAADLYAKEEVTKQLLFSKKKRNILHLSMHGIYNSTDPNFSKLLLAGSILDESKEDPYALYANEMHLVEQLTNNELVFIAACQTGQSKSGEKNQSEILGVVRPLLLNNNKNIILALWNIDDAATADFVQYFYENLKETNNIEISFFNARETLKNKYQHPWIWAPFYLLSNN